LKILEKALLGSAVVATLLVTMTGTALADYRNHWGDHPEQVTLSGQLEYGAWTGDGDTNAYGFGIGFRGGYTFDMGLYLGGDFDYFFGEDNGGSVAGIAGASTHVNVWNVMGEIGYDFWIYRHGILRPKLGLGVGVGHGSACVSVNILNVGGACDSNSQSGFAIAPGVQFLHFFSNVYFTGELRYQTISIDGPDPSAFIFAAGVGVAL
jgi:hypothetical protein